jgi:phospholipid transport system substrate-binding protein
MQFHFILSIAALGITIVVTGCASMKPSDGTMLVDQSNHHRLISPPAFVDTEDGAMHVAPFKDSPTESVRSMITDVLAVLGNEALKQPGWSEERRQQVERVIRHRVNFRQMAHRSLGSSWSMLSGKARQEFVGLFVKLLRDAFANKIDQYYDEQILYLIEQHASGCAQVRTTLIGPKVATSLDFRLEEQSGEWLVYDIVVDGISTVKNYRTQFRQIIRDNTYAGLVEKMKHRVEIVKGFEKTASAYP